MTTAEQALGSQSSGLVNGTGISSETGTGTSAVLKTTSIAGAAVRSGRDGLVGGGWWLDIGLGIVGFVVGGLDLV